MRNCTGNCIRPHLAELINLNDLERIEGCSSFASPFPSKSATLSNGPTESDTSHSTVHSVMNYVQNRKHRKAQYARHC